MTEPTGRTGPRTALRTARVGRGWSQTDAARELRALSRERDGPDASAASLKTQLSRWENGHAVPEPVYRVLLGELYGRPPEQLGLVSAATSGGPTPTERLRALLAAADAVDDGVVALWIEQLTLAHRLDDELGAAGAGDVVRAQVHQLARTLAHTLAPSRRAAVAGVLAGAATLAGRQSLDQGDPETAWAHLGTARLAAQEAGSPSADARALTGQAEVLREVGAAAAAVALLGAADPAGPPAVRVRLAAARGAAHAALGDAAAARREFDRAALAMPDVVRPHAEIEIADLQRWHGHALVTLHDPGAVAPLRSALSADPPAARHRATLHADLAVAMDHAGRRDEAAEHARTARRLAARIGSRRIIARMSITGGILDR